MDKSTLLNGWSRPSNSDLTLNDTKNDKQQNFTLPKITSTPLPASHTGESPITPTRINNLALNSKRYSLSAVNVTPPYRGGNSRLNSPSTARYNANTSTYIDAQSPGFAGRIVQYNNEEKEKFQTHNPKYGRPGAFPIVHLFKKDVPVIKLKPSKVTVRMAPTDLTKYNSPEHNRMLLEGVVQTAPKNRHNMPSQNSTRSVLDALKEISRKRIHASEEEYEQNISDSGKRMRIDYLNGGTGEAATNKNKRTRDELSPKLDESTNNGNKVMKKMCSFNELLASETSMELPFKSGNQKRRFSVSSEKSPENVKHSKLVDVETQTVLPELTNAITKSVSNNENDTITESSNADSSSTEAKKEKSPIKVFDEKPLEMMRKNRLNILMRSFCNKEIPEDLEEKTEEQKDDSEVNVSVASPEKGLVSILAAPNKSPHNRHVKFDIPGGVQKLVIPSNSTENLKPAITQTSTAVAAPVMSVSESAKAQHFNVETLTASSKSDADKSKSVAFSLPTTTSDSQQTDKPTLSVELSNEKGVENVKLKNVESTIVVPKFSFDSSIPKPVHSTTSITDLPRLVNASSSPQKMGGFKFDLSKPTSTAVTVTVTSSAAPIFSFNNTHGNEKTTVASFSLGNTNQTCTSANSSTKPDFSFGTAKKIEETNKSFELTKTTLSVNVFGPTKSGEFSLTPTTSFVSSSGTPSFSFTPQNASSSVASITKQENEKAAEFSFTMNKTPTTICPAISTTSSNISLASSAFTATTTVCSAPMFGNKTNSSTAAAIFGSHITSMPAFSSTVVPRTTSTAATTSGTFTIAASSKSFGGTFSDTTKTLTFGNTTITPAFASTTTASAFNGTTSNAFGTTTSTPMFATTSTATFGATSTSSTFGSVTSPTPPPYGGFNLSTSFGGTTTTPAFGSSTTAPPTYANATSSLAFGITSSAPSFGSTTVTPAFGGNTSSGTFGSTNAGNTFGGSTPASSFGSASFGTTTLAAPLFGSTTTSSFSSVTSSAPIFGGTTTSASFNTVTSAPSFGSSSTFGGSTPSFSSATVKPVSNFGTMSNFANTSFGGSSPKFGLTSTANSPMFGSNNTATVTSSNFGMPISTPSFSSNFTTNNTPNQMFATTAVTTAAFSFDTASKPLFGNINASSPFGGGTSNTTTTTATPNIFGATTNTATPSFGTNSSFTSSFGQNASNNTFGSSGNLPAFGANAPTTTTAPSAFGTSTVFGASNSSFGTSAPAFGIPTTAAPAFGTPATKPPMFGTPATVAPTFGTAVTTKPAFGATNTFATPNFTNSTFKQPQSDFTVPTPQNKVFTFGSATTAQKPFSFSGSEASKPNFNFNATRSASFGTSPVPAFGTAPAPQFGMQTPRTGMFSIGSGAGPSGRPRTQLKAKRRT